MATTTLTFKAQTITVPANTNEHDINFDAQLWHDDTYAHATVTMVSGTAVQFSNNGETIDTGAITLHSTGNDTKEIFEIKRGTKLKFKGGAGGEVFNISILSN
jgi:hypothetical protein